LSKVCSFLILDNLPTDLIRKPGEKKSINKLPPWKHQQLLSLVLKDPITRSLSNPNTEDADERATIGTGILSILRSTRGGDSHLVCRLSNDDGEVKFQAILPQAECASDHMHHSGTNHIFLDVVNIAVEEPLLRRFSIPFQDEIDGIAFLLTAFNNDVNLVKKFFKAKPDDQFYPQARGLPHLHCRDVNKMEVDGEEDLPMHDVPYKKSLEVFDEVNIQTQLY